MKAVEQHMAELKPEDWRLGGDLDILAVALDLHMNHTGASDSHLSFDDAAKALLEEVVKEAEGQGAWLYRLDQ